MYICKIGFFAFLITLTISVFSTTLKAKEEYTVFQKVITEFPSVKSRSSERSISDECSFKNLQLPSNLKVYGSGTYSGRRIEFQIDQSGHQARQIDVVVNEPSNPVALILGAYEPTVWNISHSPETKIHAVVVGGNHRQVISGLDESIPTLVSHSQNTEPCGSFYFSKKNIEKLNPLSRSVFKKPADMFYPVDRNGEVIIGSKDFNPATLVMSGKNPPISYKIKGTLLAGAAGLAEAVRSGILRKATKADRKVWVDKLIEREKNNPSKDLPPTAGGDSLRSSIPNMRLHDAYVVLKDFTYPAGLYGANSATFIISDGVSFPKGNPGHSKVYDLNTLKCHGAGCRIR